MMLITRETEAFLRDLELKQKHIPRDWHDMDKLAPVSGKKTKLTITLDADLTRWLRALGRGYQGRVNAILRSYMLAVVSKEIETARDYDWRGDPI